MVSNFQNRPRCSHVMRSSELDRFINHFMQNCATKSTRSSCLPQAQTEKPHETQEPRGRKRMQAFFVSKHAWWRRSRSGRYTAQNRIKSVLAARNSTNRTISANDRNHENDSMADSYRPQKSGTKLGIRNASSKRSRPVIGGLLVKMRAKQALCGDKRTKRVPGRPQREASHTPLERA